MRDREGHGQLWCLLVSSTEMGNTGGGKGNEFSFGHIEFEKHVELQVKSIH